MSDARSVYGGWGSCEVFARGASQRYKPPKISTSAASAHRRARQLRSRRGLRRPYHVATNSGLSSVQCSEYSAAPTAPASRPAVAPASAGRVERLRAAPRKPRRTARWPAAESCAGTRWRSIRAPAQATGRAAAAAVRRSPRWPGPGPPRTRPPTICPDSARLRQTQYRAGGCQYERPRQQPLEQYTRCRGHQGEIVTQPGSRKQCHAARTAGRKQPSQPGSAGRRRDAVIGDHRRDEVLRLHDGLPR